MHRDADTGKFKSETQQGHTHAHKSEDGQSTATTACFDPDCPNDAPADQADDVDDD